MNKRTKKHIYDRLTDLLQTYKIYLRHTVEYNFYTASALNMAYRTGGYNVLGAYFMEDVISQYEYLKWMSIWSKLMDKYSPNVLTLAEDV